MKFGRLSVYSIALLRTSSRNCGQASRSGNPERTGVAAGRLVAAEAGVAAEPAADRPVDAGSTGGGINTGGGGSTPGGGLMDDSTGPAGRFSSTARMMAGSASRAFSSCRRMSLTRKPIPRSRINSTTRSEVTAPSRVVVTRARSSSSLMGPSATNGFSGTPTRATSSRQPKARQLERDTILFPPVFPKRYGPNGVNPHFSPGGCTLLKSATWRRIFRFSACS